MKTLQPFFLLGALRSGTTVFRLMLKSHEGINAPGETDYIFDYLIKHPNSRDWICNVEGLRQDRVFLSQKLDILNSKNGEEVAQNLVDQLSRRAKGFLCLCIHGNADKAAAIFPDSKIIHIVRDPRDVAKSCIGMGWAGNTYFGIDPWVETEINWNSSVPLYVKKNILEVRFEELIADPKTQLERVCQFIGLQFSSEMLNYSAHTTYAPPDPSAIEQWKSMLSPRDVALIEIKAKTLLLQRNYKLSGYPLDPPSLSEKVSLVFSNKIYKWKFGLKRYGATNFILEKVTRKILKSRHYLFLQRINEIDEHYLK